MSIPSPVLLGAHVVSQVGDVSQHHSTLRSFIIVNIVWEYKKNILFVDPFDFVQC